MSSRDKGDRDKTPEEERDDELDAILMDPNKKEALLKKMGLGSEENRTEVRRNLTPTGKSTGWPAVACPPMPFWPTPYPPFPFPVPGYPVPIWREGCGTEGGWVCHDSREYHIDDDDGPGPSERSLRRAEEEDVIDPLDEEEALELVEFDPKVESKDTWPPPKATRSFLEKHFNKSLSEEEREAILKDFLKPDTY